MIAAVRITSDLGQLQRCCEFRMEDYLGPDRTWLNVALGQKVRVLLPPIPRARMLDLYVQQEGRLLCDSDLFWEAVALVHFKTGAPVAFCRHMLDID